MKAHYDFSRAKRGPVVRSKGKTRITIRIDDDLLDWFRERAHAEGGGSYQSLINDALRSYVSQEGGALEGALRTVVREELARYTVTRRPPPPGSPSSRSGRRGS